MGIPKFFSFIFNFLQGDKSHCFNNIGDSVKFAGLTGVAGAYIPA